MTTSGTHRLDRISERRALGLPVQVASCLNESSWRFLCAFLHYATFLRQVDHLYLSPVSHLTQISSCAIQIQHRRIGPHPKSFLLIYNLSAERQINHSLHRSALPLNQWEQFARGNNQMVEMPAQDNLFGVEPVQQVLPFCILFSNLEVASTDNTLDPNMKPPTTQRKASITPRRFTVPT